MKTKESHPSKEFFQLSMYNEVGKHISKYLDTIKWALQYIQIYIHLFMYHVLVPIYLAAVCSEVVLGDYVFLSFISLEEDVFLSIYQLSSGLNAFIEVVYKEVFYIYTTLVKKPFGS